MYMMHDGITGLSITKGARHNVLPVSSLGGGIDFDFDSQNDTIYVIHRGIMGNVSTCKCPHIIVSILYKLNPCF